MSIYPYDQPYDQPYQPYRSLLGGSSHESEVGNKSLVISGLILLIPLITGDSFPTNDSWDDPPSTKYYPYPDDSSHPDPRLPQTS